MKKRLLTLLVCIASMCGVYAAPTFVAETDTADYVPSVPSTPSEPTVPNVPYEPLDTGTVVTPPQPSQSTIYVPTIQDWDAVTEYPHNPAVDKMLSSVKPHQQEFTMTIEGDYLRIKGTLEARGYDKHYIHCQIIGDSVHLQRFDMDPKSTDMLLHYVDILIPGFTEDYYHVTLAEQNDVPLYREYMVMSRPVSRVPVSSEFAGKPDWVGSVWSYTNYDYERYTFYRYTVLDNPEIINGKTYYPLVMFNESIYEEGKELGKWRIRQEGKRVYVLKEDYSFERSDILQLKEVDNDYLLYDFGLKLGDEYAKFGKQSESVVVAYDSICKSTNGQIFEWHLLGDAEDGFLWGDDLGWLDGIGGMEDLLVPFNPESVNCICGSILNYYRSADGTVEYINPSDEIYTGYKSDDEVASSNRFIEIGLNKTVNLQTMGSAVCCTSPTAVKLEVYTMDAIKVGEAAFTSGEASVKVGKAPATYLCIVTYPDGRRESGKVMITE